MRKSRWLLMSLLLLGLVAAEAAASQEQPGQTQATIQRQRAPGVPMAPGAEDPRKATPPADNAGSAAERNRMARNRPVPMPKPVPSIIAR